MVLLQGTPRGDPLQFLVLLNAPQRICPQSQKPENVLSLFITTRNQGKTHTDGDFSLLIMCSRLSFYINCRDCPAQIIRRIEFLK